MATTNTQSPASAPANTTDESKQQNSPEQESANDSFTKSISASVEPMREDQVQNAVKFLSHPKVRGSPVIYRRSFLEKKGLTGEEIDEAFRRVPDPPSNVTSVEAATAKQAASQKPSTNLQLQVPQPVSAPMGVVPATSTMQQYRFHWSHALLALGMLTASGAGTAVLFKNVVVPRLKAWVRLVVKEEDDAEKKESSKPNIVEEAAEAAKAAAEAAALVAKANQELLHARTEEGKSFEALKDLLSVQVEEMKSMGNAIRKLESTRETTLSQDKQIQERNKYASGNGLTNNTPNISHVDQADSSFSYMYSKQGKMNGTSDADSGAVRPSSAPASVEPTSAPFSKSYMDIMAMVQRGEIPPGIKEVNDMPPNPNQLPSNPRVAPRIKPWEAVQQDPQKSDFGFQQRMRVDGYPQGQTNGHSSQINGKSHDSSESSWERKSVKIAEIEPETEEQKTISYGIGSSEWRGRGWVPPQPPSVAIPEAAAAIRQPKSSGHKQQLTEQSMTPKPSEIVEDGAVGPSGSANEAGCTGTELAVPTYTEIQEEPVNAVDVQ